MRAARDWIERQSPTQTGVLHFVIAARQAEPEARFRILELDEADEAMQRAREAGLPAYCEQPPQGRFVTIRADQQSEEDDT